MNVVNIPKGRMGKVSAALEILKSVDREELKLFRWPTTLRYISMVAGESLKREARKKGRRRKANRKAKR